MSTTVSVNEFYAAYSSTPGLGGGSPGVGRDVVAVVGVSSRKVPSDNEGVLILCTISYGYMLNG